ncbi:LysR family transcriptional regulator [Paraburkholderia gardini]|jgi:DNA-binding transcriptional LysR family regulator|uniref:HTH-type transcriptional regulator BenM n=1 Tax=Paraburkholderia gardini TaxID=2823469 RepID=A0ABM8U6P6_9BURK|nr:LysR family transcriptional regulator [Paraburkholderia gardini]CAG4909476.1 HTH-type transcriptional regulator BenM [Paraburkholderia gardini]
MDLRQLRYFIAVAEEQNFSRAAERLHMTQPPLSRQMQLLEEEIGVPLFVRGARPLKMTEAGQILYEKAPRVLNEADGLAPLTRQLMRTTRRIVIGFVPSTLYGPLPEVIRAFRKATPGVELSVIEMFSLEQTAALKAARIDIGFGRIRMDDDQLAREVLAEEDLIAALPATHSLASDKTPLPLAALAKETVIVYPGQPRPSYADQQISALRDQALEPHAIHEVMELQTALGLVAAEIGVCLVPRSVAGLRARGVVYRELANVNVTSPIIMSRRQQDRSEANDLFCAVAREFFAAM